MDLYNDINYVDQEFEVEHPATDKGTGFFLTIRSPYSHEVKKAQRKIQNELYSAMASGKKKSAFTAEHQDANKEKLILAAVCAWRWEGDVTLNGEQPEFSTQKLREWVRDPKLTWLKEWLDHKMADHNAFLDELQDS